MFFFFRVFLLALNRTNRQTGNKVLLEERIRARNGNDDNDCDCHTNGFGRHRVTVLLQTQTCAGVIGDVLQVLHHVVQQCLQGYQLGIRNIQGRLEPVIPVASICQKVEAQLKEANIRCSVDGRSEKMGYKIREARLNRVPYMLIVGAKEEEEQKVSVRSRYLGDEGSKDLGEFIEAIKDEIAKKTIRKIEVEE